jgi:hypothetical protein
MSLDMAPAYGLPGLASLKRRFVFDMARGNLTLEDRFVFSGSPLPVTERFVSIYPPELKDGFVRIDTGDSVSLLKCSLSTEPVINEQEHRSHEGKSTRIFLIDFSFVPTDLDFSVGFEIA